MSKLRTGHYKDQHGGIVRLTVTKTGWLIKHKDGTVTEIRRDGAK